MSNVGSLASHKRLVDCLHRICPQIYLDLNKQMCVRLLKFMSSFAVHCVRFHCVRIFHDRSFVAAPLRHKLSSVSWLSLWLSIALLVSVVYK